MPEAAKAIAPDDAPHTDADDYKRIFIWQGHAPMAAASALAEAILEEADLVSVEDRLHWVHDGECTPVSLTILRELFDRHIVTRRRVNRGTQAKPVWECELYPFAFPPAGDLRTEPTEVILKMFLGVKPQPYGDLPDNFPSLAARAPRA
jgi:hypothetical protein